MSDQSRFTLRGLREHLKSTYDSWACFPEIICRCLYVNSTPKAQIHRNTRKVQISTKGWAAGGGPPLCGGGQRPPSLVFLCIWVLGVEFTYKNRHMISGKHAQELYQIFICPLRPLKSMTLSLNYLLIRLRAWFRRLLVSVRAARLGLGPAGSTLIYTVTNTKFA